MKVHAEAPFRAGLAGNPSDGYGGRAVAVALGGFRARATVEAGSGLTLDSPRDGLITLALPACFDAGLVAPGRPHRLAVACCRLFYARAREEHWLDAVFLDRAGFRLHYDSDIPERVGLGGSSALIVAILRALAQFHEVTIRDEDLPTLALQVETREMGIHGGLMDRVAQVLGGLTYMNLSESRIRQTGRGEYERLATGSLPPLFIAWHSGLASGSELVHNALRERVARGDPVARAILADLADLADEARRVLLSGTPAALGGIMNENFELRTRLIDVSEGDRQLVEIGRRHGAAVKQAGSGGAVVGIHDGDPARLESLSKAYRAIGAGFQSPGVWEAPTAASTIGETARRATKE